MDGWSRSLHLSFVFLVHLKKYFNEVELCPWSAPAGLWECAQDLGWLAGEGFTCSLPELCLIHLQLEAVIQGSCIPCGAREEDVCIPWAQTRAQEVKDVIAQCPAISIPTGSWPKCFSA